MMDTTTAGIDVQARTQTQQQTKLRKACADFESLFLNYMLKSMRSSVPEGGITGGSEEGRMFQSMFDEKLADQMRAELLQSLNESQAALASELRAQQDALIDHAAREIQGTVERVFLPARDGI